MSNAEKAELYTQMGSRYLDLDMLDVAKEKLDMAMKLDSSSGEVHSAMGSFYERIRDYEAADKSYATAVSKAPDNYNIVGNYGRFLCDRGDYKQGMALLQKALDIPMNNHQWFALTGLGNCYVQQNDLHNGEDYLRKALQQQPQFAPALLEMQKVSYETQQYMSARAFLERYLGVARQTPESLWIAFQTERALGNGKAAEEYRRELLTSYPGSDEAQEIKNIVGN